MQLPPFFAGLTPDPEPVTDITGARALAVLGDSITTDHISPAGSIPASSPAGRYLVEHGVEPRDFNSFGSRRGNHEVMMRGTFGNIRLRNALAGGKEGNWTEYLPTGEITSIYEAAMAYQAAGIPLVVLAGALYGNGSSRDWAAKGTLLLGVRAVIAKSFERIHRGNLVGMGVLPLQFREGEGVDELGLTGRESFDIRLTGLRPPRGADRGLHPGGRHDRLLPGPGADRRTHGSALPGERGHPAHRPAPPLPGEHHRLVPSAGYRSLRPHGFTTESTVATISRRVPTAVAPMIG